MKVHFCYFALYWLSEIKMWLEIKGNRLQESKWKKWKFVCSKQMGVKLCTVVHEHSVLGKRVSLREKQIHMHSMEQLAFLKTCCLFVCFFFCVFWGFFVGFFLCEIDQHFYITKFSMLNFHTWQLQQLNTAEAQYEMVLGNASITL